MRNSRFTVVRGFHGDGEPRLSSAMFPRVGLLWHAVWRKQTFLAKTITKHVLLLLLSWELFLAKTIVLFLLLFWENNYFRPKKVCFAENLAIEFAFAESLPSFSTRHPGGEFVFANNHMFFRRWNSYLEIFREEKEIVSRKIIRGICRQDITFLRGNLSWTGDSGPTDLRLTIAPYSAAQ